MPDDNTKAKAAIGLGEWGGGRGGRGSSWRQMPIIELARVNAPFALARAVGSEFIPAIRSCQAVFSDPAVMTIPNVAWQGGQPGATLDRAGVVESVMFEIDAQNNFPGSLLKPLNDFFFGLQSGITAKLDVIGGPPYTIASFFQPLRLLVAMLNEDWPDGWFLNFTQGVVMTFSASLPLPPLPVIVTVSFKMWQPLDEQFSALTRRDALCRLQEMGLCPADCLPR